MTELALREHCAVSPGGLVVRFSWDSYGMNVSGHTLIGGRPRGLHRLVNPSMHYDDRKAIEQEMLRQLDDMANDA